MAKATINVPVSIDLSTIQRWMESSDIVEVVRCKDCKHRHDDGYCEAWGDSFHHWEDFNKVPEDMFCGYGERREDETD